MYPARGTRLRVVCRWGPDTECAGYIRSGRGLRADRPPGRRSVRPAPPRSEPRGQSGNASGPAAYLAAAHRPSSGPNRLPPWSNFSKSRPSGGRPGILPISIRCRRGRCKPGSSGNRRLVQQAQMVRQRTASLEQLEEQIAAHCRQLQSCLVTLHRGTLPLRVATRSLAERQRRRPCRRRSSPRSTPCSPRGDSILEQIKETAESRRQLEREKNRLAKAVTQAEAKAVQAEADLTAMAGPMDRSHPAAWPAQRLIAGRRQ